MSHVSHRNESCLTHKWVMSHIRASHVPYMNESCPIYEWVMSHIWMNHVPYMNESCPIYEWVMSHIRASHVPYLSESRHTYMNETSRHIYMNETLYEHNLVNFEVETLIKNVVRISRTWRLNISKYYRVTRQLRVFCRTSYGVASDSRIDKNISLFCKRAL